MSAIWYHSTAGKLSNQCPARGRAGPATFAIEAAADGKPSIDPGPDVTNVGFLGLRALRNELPGRAKRKIDASAVLLFTAARSEGEEDCDIQNPPRSYES